MQQNVAYFVDLFRLQLLSTVDPVTNLWDFVRHGRPQRVFGAGNIFDRYTVQNSGCDGKE